MMESLNDRQLCHLAWFSYPYRTTVRRILIQRTVRSPWIIIIQVRRQQSFEMSIVEDDDVIQKCAS